MNAGRRFSFALVTLAFLLISAPRALRGQVVTAALNGRILDPSGAAIPDAVVTITDIGTGKTHSVTTGHDGLYAFPVLDRGQYTLTVVAADFQKIVHSGIVLQVGETANLNVTMQLDSQTQSVSVTGSVPVLVTQSAALAGVVSQEQIQTLPLNQLNYQSLELVQPSVFLPAQNSTIGFRGGVEGGQSEVNNSFNLDGVDNLDEASNQPNVVPVLDAVQEFRVVTGSYNAEYGRFSGGHVVVVTKSGTNDFHGSAYFFYRNSAMDAENYFSTSNPPTS